MNKMIKYFMYYPPPLILYTATPIYTQLIRKQERRSGMRNRWKDCNRGIYKRLNLFIRYILLIIDRVPVVLLRPKMRIIIPHAIILEGNNH